MTLKLLKLSTLIVALTASAFSSCATTDKYQNDSNKTHDVKFIDRPDTYPVGVWLTGGYVTVTPEAILYLDGKRRLLEIISDYEAKGVKLFIAPNLSASAINNGVNIPVPFFTNDGLLQFQSDHPEFFDSHSKYFGTVGFGNFIPLN